MEERQPRRAGPVWAWVLGLVVLIVLLWLAIDFVTVDEEPVRPPAVEQPVDAVGAAPAVRGPDRVATAARPFAQGKEAA